MDKSFIDDTSVVKTEDIGYGTTIWQYCVVLRGVKIGKNVNINSHCFIENDVVIGDNVTIKSGVYLWKGTEIENNVQVGPNVTFLNDRYPRAKNKNYKLEGITIKRGASIGGGSTLMCGTTIGSYALVGAGSLILEDVSDYSLVFGNPAKKKGYVCECGHPIKFNENIAKCNVCKKEYGFVRKEVKRIK